MISIKSRKKHRQLILQTNQTHLNFVPFLHKERLGKCNSHATARWWFEKFSPAARVCGSGCWPHNLQNDSSFKLTEHSGILAVLSRSHVSIAKGKRLLNVYVHRKKYFFPDTLKEASNLYVINVPTYRGIENDVRTVPLP